MQEKIETVRDYMILFSEYPKVNHDTTLQEAVKIMYSMYRERGFRWLIVLNEGGNIMGFLTLRRVLETISSLAPKAGGFLGIFTYNRPGFFYWQGLPLIKDTPLKKCIRPLVDVYVNVNDHPSKAAELILNRRITIVPVLDDEEKVVGIVRPIDLFPFISKLFEQDPHGPGMA